MKYKSTIIVLCCVAMIGMTGFYLGTRNTSKANHETISRWKLSQITQLEKRVNKLCQDVEMERRLIKELREDTTKMKFQMYLNFVGTTGALNSNIYMSNQKEKCNFVTYSLNSADIETRKLYQTVNFNDPDRHDFRSRWNITLNDSLWKERRNLTVYVVPFSHNDPGWINTFEEYYKLNARKILNNMVEKLSTDSKGKFTWAEISFFSKWWDELDRSRRNQVKSLLRAGQLEFVTGGWVMNDEASSHWTATLLQMIEGHQWLQYNLNYTPSSSWSIDPFGVSATQTSLLNNMGFENLVVNRIHYVLKRHFAEHQQLEFRWKQAWDYSRKTEVFTHVMPFYGYEIPYTCGPDPMVCCQFDFVRLIVNRGKCPWKMQPAKITETNVAEKAKLLLDQYRKKSQLFKTSVLLVPLGDDFYYTSSEEWDVQFENYQMLFNYLNSNPDLGVNIQFGTLSDYFDVVKEAKSVEAFPSLSGDFFTYASLYGQYWSGCYSSRSFFKRLDRILMAYVRSADILLSLSLLHSKLQRSSQEYVYLETYVTDARRSLALFQHHDGLSGTAKDHVFSYYAKSLFRALEKSYYVTQFCTQRFLSKPGINSSNTAKHFDISDIHFYNGTVLYEREINLLEGETKRIVIFNSLTFRRVEVVNYMVSTRFVKVTDCNGTTKQAQISPYFKDGFINFSAYYRVTFIVNLQALSLSTYCVTSVSPGQLPLETKFSNITVYDENTKNPKKVNIFTNKKILSKAKQFTVSSEHVTATFSPKGLLRAITLKDGSVAKLEVDFARYFVRSSKKIHEANLFIPVSSSIPLSVNISCIVVIQGPIFSSVSVQLPYIQHIATLYNNPLGTDGMGIELQNYVDVSQMRRKEIVMEIKTNIKNGNVFFTDLNGFQITRRERHAQIPLQGNFYPMSTTSYIEDDTTRFTLLTASPTGVTLIEEGRMQVLLGHNIAHDSFHNAEDNFWNDLPTKYVFKLVVEKKLPYCQTTSDDHLSGFETVVTHTLSQTLLHPLIKMIDCKESIIRPNNVNIGNNLGVDVVVPIIRNNIYVSGQFYTGIAIHRQHLDICYADADILKLFPLNPGSQINVSSLVAQHVRRMHQTSLSFLHVRETKVEENIGLCPMDTKAFILEI